MPLLVASVASDPTDPAVVSSIDAVVATAVVEPGVGAPELESDPEPDPSVSDDVPEACASSSEHAATVQSTASARNDHDRGMPEDTAVLGWAECDASCRSSSRG